MPNRRDRFWQRPDEAFYRLSANNSARRRLVPSAEYRFFPVLASTKLRSVHAEVSVAVEPGGLPAGAQVTPWWCRGGGRHDLALVGHLS